MRVGLYRKALNQLREDNELAEREAELKEAEARSGRSRTNRVPTTRPPARTATRPEFLAGTRECHGPNAAHRGGRSRQLDQRSR